MNTGLTIALIITLLVISGGLFLLIFLLIRNQRYKKFVLYYSATINDLISLNGMYQFQDFNNLDFHHVFDNKSSWYKTEPIAYLSRQIRNNFEYWHRLKGIIDGNRELYNKYKADLQKVFSMTLARETCESHKYNYKKCHKIELKIANSKVLLPKLDVIINVRLRYISPKGKVDVSKCGVFGYLEFTRILDSVSTKRVDRQTYERLALAERAMLSDSMRYDVLRRDGFRCVLCGMSSRDGAILHVDHIIPISKGGKTEMSNLRTLCERCNLGKSNKIE